MALLDSDLKKSMAFYFHLTILTEKTVFYSIQYMNGWLAASDVFDASSEMLTH